METTLSTGIRGSYTETVTAEKTARHYGSGMVEVLATPAMIAAMEKTCMESVSPYLPEGMQTVGTYVQVSHIKATRIGLDVAYHAVLTQINGNELTFEVNANDTVGEIGSGIHKRFIINVEKFLKKLEQ